MKGITDICRLFTLIGFALLVDQVNAVAPDNGTSETERCLEETRVAWNEFLLKNFESGATEQTVRKLMQGKYRDYGLARSNNNSYQLLFLIDDYHQVEFRFDKNSKLIVPPWIEPKGKWLRMPNGDVRTIPHPTEVKLRSQATAAAIEYVMKHTNHNRDSLSAFCRRIAKAKTWHVVVMTDTLEVDAPTYSLELTDDGQVSRFR